MSDGKTLVKNVYFTLRNATDNIYNLTSDSDLVVTVQIFDRLPVRRQPSLGLLLLIVQLPKYKVHIVCGT